MNDGGGVADRCTGEEGRAAEQLRRGGWRGSRRCAAASGRIRGVDEVEGYVTVPRGGGRQRRLMHGRGGRGLPEETSTRRKERPARATVFRRNSGEEEVMPGMRAVSRSRGRWWRRRSALRQGDRGGWRRPAWRKGKGDGGNAAPGVSAGNGGQAGEGEAAAMLEEATARPDHAPARRERRLEAAGGTGERGGRRGEG
uniref:BKRF1 encodes EBNA-1 protein-like n=1 Tax=Oryza sativa subsp. japonica TaxID=39947 RepID=Q5Z441_ORYSJ|nr:BKRF1 encodes EBNA-1 protein-like [Oryza sativa Japonica Group]